MNSTPTSKSNSDTNAKSTPQPVFNYAQAAKRNSQPLEQQQKTNPTSTGPSKPSDPGSPSNKLSPTNSPLKQQQSQRQQAQQRQKSTENTTSTTLQKDSDNTNTTRLKHATPAKSVLASIDHNT
jgi:translation initiation factor 4G